VQWWPVWSTPGGRLGGVFAGFTNLVVQVDTVATGDHAPTLPGPAWPDSTHNWNIKWVYRVKGTTDTSFSGTKDLMQARHEAHITTTGATTIQKAGTGPFVRQAAAPTSDY
jgi:hypothetical protein